MADESEFNRLVEGCRALPPSQDYSEDDYIRNVFLTVLDFQMVGQAVKNAIPYYETHHWSRIRNHQDLVAELAKFPDDEMGNRRLARHFWGNEHWVRAAPLRNLVDFLQGIGATTQDRLRDWVTKSDFRGQDTSRGP